MTTTTDVIVYDRSARAVGSELPVSLFPAEAGHTPTGTAKEECGYRAQDGDGADWFCTREAGHGGTHVAHFDSDEAPFYMSVGLTWKTEETRR